MSARANRNQKLRARQSAKRSDATSSISTRPGTNLLTRVQTVVPVNGPMRNRSAVKMTGAQRNSIGKRSEWNLPTSGPSTFTDPKWGFTVSDGAVR